jgi:2',3'-cyclic-nucleotide 2'-phosphodiesterase (5'-nucleotidase family)
LEGLKEVEHISLSNGMSIGVIGLTASVGNFYELFGLRFPDFCELTKRLVSQLKTGGASLIVVLSHLGLKDDRRLADEVSGINLIIGAHTHDKLPEGEVRNGVLIAQAGEYAKSLGRIDLMLDPSTGLVANYRADVLDVPDDTPPDREVLMAISAAEEEVKEIMAQPIGELTELMGQDYFNECDLGNMTADALRTRMRSDIAMVSSGQFRQPLQAGTLTLGQLDAACFSTANPWLSDVRGEQILEALVRGLDPSISEVKHPSYRGAPIGIPQISGMRVYYDSKAPGEPRVRRVDIQGKPIEPDQIYRLAHTDAETMPEVGYLVLDVGQTVEQEVPTILREVIADYVRGHSPLSAPQRGRWILIS